MAERARLIGANGSMNGPSALRLARIEGVGRRVDSGDCDLPWALHQAEILTRSSLKRLLQLVGCELALAGGVLLRRERASPFIRELVESGSGFGVQPGTGDRLSSNGLPEGF